MDNMSAVGSPQDLLPDNQHKVGYGAFLDEGKVLCRKRTLKEKHEIPENIMFMVIYSTACKEGVQYLLNPV